MYVFTENAILAFLAHEEDERLLEVRAKYRGDLERTFPEAEIGNDPEDEFPFYTAVSRDRAAERIALRMKHIGYRNFTPGSEEPWRQKVYSDVESVLRAAQESPGPGTEA